MRPGDGTGQFGRGQGGLAQESETQIGFQKHRGKVQSTKGRIIGEFLIDGQQIKGEVSKSLSETLEAEEREATDLIYKDRIPRQYQKSVKEYFSDIQRQIAKAGISDDSDDKEKKPADKDEAETKVGTEKESSDESSSEQGSEAD